MNLPALSINPIHNVNNSTNPFNNYIENYQNRIICGNCADVLSSLPEKSFDLTVADPPYMVRYQDRTGRTVENDNNSEWLPKAFTQIYRVMKDNSLCLSFYAWNRVEIFMECWRSVGFYPVGHIPLIKRYSSKKRFVGYCHENLYLLAKGRPEPSDDPIDDVLDWDYSGNLLHPTQLCPVI